MSEIHPSALVDGSALIGAGSRIGPFTIVHANVVLGANVCIGSHCEIGVATPHGDGSPLMIGDNAVIRSHSVFYESSVFGPGLVTGHYVAAREMTRAGTGLQLGSASDVQGHCEIGDYVRTHRGVHVGKASRIGNFVWMSPDVLLSNDPNPPSDQLIGSVVGDFSVIAARSTLLPGVQLGKHVFIAAHSLVGLDVADGMMAAGAPARVVGKASMVHMKNDVRVRAYPWNRRFTRGYPESVVLSWTDESGLPT